MNKAVLIRHGLTEANKKHLYCGSTDIPLSQEGREALGKLKETVYQAAEGKTWQAAEDKILQAAEEKCSGDAPALLYVTSGLKRCTETLHILFSDVEETVMPAFSEMDFGAFEMHSYEELKEDPDYQTWITGDNEANVTPGGESGLQMQERTDRAFDELLSQEKDVILVTHGGVIAQLMDRFFPEEGRNRYEWQPACGRGYEIVFQENSAVGYSRI